MQPAKTPKFYFSAWSVTITMWKKVRRVPKFSIRRASKPSCLCQKDVLAQGYRLPEAAVWNQVTQNGSVLPWETRESHAWVLHRNCRREKRLIDATLEPYTCHPGRSCFGRPCNHVNENDLRCNMRMVEIQADKIDGLKERWRRVVFVARRDIKPMEQLMFDYGDINARRIFWKNELSSIS